MQKNLGTVNFKNIFTYINILNVVKNPFFITGIAYLMALIYINPLGNYIVNDEWAHLRQVEAFLTGRISITANTDAVLILQALIGATWSLLVGFEIYKMKLLGILMSYVMLYGCYKIFKLLKVNSAIILISLLTIVYNPLIFHLSSTFMTDIYFLTFAIWSSCFFIAGLEHFLTNKETVKRSKHKNIFIKHLHNLYLIFIQEKNIFVGCIFCVGACLIRQIGLVVFIAFFITTFAYLKNIKIFVYKIFPFTLVILGGIFIYAVWPRYTNTGHNQSLFQGLINLSRDIIDPKDLIERLNEMLRLLPYFFYFALPVILGFSFVQKPRHQTNTSKQWLRNLLYTVGNLLLAIPFVKLVFEDNVFGLGNVLYLEGFYAKTAPFLDETLLVHRSTKFVIAVIVSIAIARLTLLAIDSVGTFVYKKYKKLDIAAESTEQPASYKKVLFISLLCFGMFIALVLGNDLYDRYILPATVFFIILIAYVISIRYKFNLITATLFLMIFIFVTILLQQDFVNNTKLKWKQAQEISLMYNVEPSKIFVDGNYTRYTKAQKIKDFTGLTYIDSSEQYKCYTQTYTIDIESTKVQSALDNIQNYLDTKYATKLEIYKRKAPTVPKISKYQNQTIHNDAYPSLIHELIGRKGFVGSFCVTALEKK